MMKKINFKKQLAWLISLTLILSFSFAFKIHAESEPAPDSEATILVDATKDTLYDITLKSPFPDNVTWSLKTSYEQDTDSEITTTEDTIILPDGITLTEDGHLKGVPLKAGTWKFTITIKTDTETREITYVLNVKDPVTPPIEDDPDNDPVTPPIEDDPDNDPVTPPVEDDPDDVPVTPPVEDDPDDVPVTPPVEDDPDNEPVTPPVEDDPDNEPVTPPVEDDPDNVPVTPPVEDDPDNEPVTPPVEDDPDDKPAAPAPENPVILTTSLPNGTVGTKYTAGIEAKSTTQLTWSLKTGSALPDGLKLEGDTITGTPAKAGTWEFTLIVENEAGATEKSLSILVKEAEKKNVNYQITKGDNGVHTIGSGKSLSFSCNGDIKELTGIYLDKSLVNSKNYTLKSDGTTVTFKPEYLDKLKVGKHTVTFQYSDGSASTNFKVITLSMVKTGDTSATQFWLFTLALATVLASAAAVIRRRCTR